MTSYLVGFVRPSGFAWSPASFGSYGNELMIADTGRFASENDNERDGSVYRVEKGIARPFAAGMMDPTDLKFIEGKAVICDPAEKGKRAGRNRDYLVAALDAEAPRKALCFFSILSRARASFDPVPLPAREGVRG